MINLKDLDSNHKIAIILGSIIAIIISIILGCIFFPTIFYDQFIWKYFWGPIVSDISGYQVSFNGVQAEQKYTIVSEITYGIIILSVLYGFYKLSKKWHIRIDWRFCLALLPYILVGSIARVLEDSNFFNEPIVYWFVTPLIYIQILIWVLVIIVLGFFLQKRIENKFINFNSILFVSGIFLLAPFLFFMIQWLIGNQWSSGYGVRYDIFILISVLVFIITFLVYLISNFFKDKSWLKIYSNPLNLAMIAGHMIDGITSYISIYDPLNMGLGGYREIHPASDLIMKIWPPLFPIVKFILIISIIYLFDIYYKEDLKEYGKLINILKIGIFILGFAPGLRDLLRVVLGV